VLSAKQICSAGKGYQNIQSNDCRKRTEALYGNHKREQFGNLSYHCLCHHHWHHYGCHYCMHPYHFLFSYQKCHMHALQLVYITIIAQQEKHYSLLHFCQTAQAMHARDNYNHQCPVISCTISCHMLQCPTIGYQILEFETILSGYQKCILCLYTKTTHCDHLISFL